MDHLLETPIVYLKGVGPKRADLLKSELNIFTFKDLIEHYPFRYVDKSKFFKISEIKGDMPSIQIEGSILSLNELGIGKSKRLVAKFSDGSSQIDLVWFKQIKWIQSSINLAKNYVVFGKPNFFNGSYSIIHPEITESEEYSKIKANFFPVYSTTDKLSKVGLNSRGISKIIINLITNLTKKIDETLSDEILRKLNLPSLHESFINIHQPSSIYQMQISSKRLKFDEFFFLQLYLLKNKLLNKKKLKGYDFKIVGSNFNNYYNNVLKFDLTNAQKRVLKEIRKDLAGSAHMNRLLQGDVGSGKTLVAILSMLISLDNGFQSCLMAPTEILAQQHYETISKELKSIGVNVQILTGSTKKSQRKVIHEKLLSGDVDILVGTHALIEDSVQFKSLGIVIIDEQHRFGVAQRGKLWKKNKLYPPHILVMTATPIPRTLSMTIYGDLDISIIDELPPGRKVINTIWKSDSSRLQIISLMKREISLGRQIYVVFPLIEESKKLDHKNLMDGYENLIREFPLPDFQISIVHGKMTNEEKEYEMKRFVDGIANILVATTVIEVGVNVPNASVMIIESSERFGLSQLHQLRGRVGRGSDQSYCVLVSGDKLSSEAKKRLSTMVKYTDGFKISEVDLEIRGPGDLMGTQQSGIINFKIADLIKDNKILVRAREEVKSLLKEDSDLSKPKNILIKNRLRSYESQKMNWGRIS